ncbi:MAG: SUMF1/EgtB/PvdO family nonheme iron enzyme [Saprospirales bacterium]|nr:SUMF1/EgtB/PvdO family nonheme iron enzyme [Saprospirales bacterium]
MCVLVDAVAYCNWRSQQEGLTPSYTILGENVTCNWSANGYRLPTEAEWEYAARQRGQKVRFGNGKDVVTRRRLILMALPVVKAYSMVGGIPEKDSSRWRLNSPNNLGLYDMSGNVWEWCWDWYGTYPSGASSNPKGPDSGSNRVIRGGSWVFRPAGVRVALRYGFSPGYRYEQHRVPFS